MVEIMNIYNLIDYNEKHLDIIEKCQSLGIDTSLLLDPNLSLTVVLNIFNCLKFDKEVTESCYDKFITIIFQSNGFLMDLSEDETYTSDEKQIIYDEYVRTGIDIRLLYKLNYTKKSCIEKDIITKLKLPIIELQKLRKLSNV